MLRAIADCMILCMLAQQLVWIQRTDMHFLS